MQNQLGSFNWFHCYIAFGFIKAFFFLPFQIDKDVTFTKTLCICPSIDSPCGSLFISCLVFVDNITTGRRPLLPAQSTSLEPKESRGRSRTRRRSCYNKIGSFITGWYRSERNFDRRAWPHGSIVCASWFVHESNNARGRELDTQCTFTGSGRE